MSAAEVCWRMGRVVRDGTGGRRSIRHSRVLERELDWATAFDQFRSGALRPILLDGERARAIGAEHPALVEEFLVAARSAAERHFAYFGYAGVQLPQQIDWNFDPTTNTRWPLVPATRIDHRTRAGDVKWIWELNRMQHLPWLAQAWLITGDDAFSVEACRQLDSWLAQNPPGRGIAWRGAFEAGVRAISVAVAVQGLRDSSVLTIDRYRAVLEMLAESARRCWAERSRFSSANNHLVGEMAGMATVAILFPELAQARRWERLAVAELVTQADRQILADGAGAEQAVGYQVFTAELMLIVSHFLHLRDGAPCEPLITAIGRSADYLSTVTGDNDPEPRYGDDDEGFALRLGPEPVRTVREHLAIVGAASGDTALATRGTTSLTALWLEVPATATSSMPAGGDLYAPNGGLVVLRSASRRVSMDVGPLGFLSIAAHGHADALALTLSSDGVELIGDPGPGSYYGNPGRRQVFRSTRAHATVMVDGVDQSTIGGPFLWSSHATVRVRHVDLAAGIVDAEHDGYRRLKQPVRHRRWLVAPPGRSTVLVVDLLTGRGEHDATISWPLSPRLVADDVEGGFAIRGDDGSGLQLLCAATAKLTSHQHRGDNLTHLGWWSERLERAVPATLLGVNWSGPVPVAFASLLRPYGDGNPVSLLSVSISSRHINVTWRSGHLSECVRLGLDGDGVVNIAPEHDHVK